MKTSYHKQLRIDIQRMSRETKLYLLLKEELSALGYWKKRPRGKPDGSRLKGYLKKESGPVTAEPLKPTQSSVKDEYRQDEGLDW